ncbi:Uncharacterised protein [[Clostridium] sordellii]|uniref:hypothetical protein n=1 Tax=Paraclostridium sordellii TaxID=1505 RepID=UPI0005DC2791|nr:hypothetical protein [Paeniclostridium sordellii]CEQ22080.1 Uncharacterised protein [[Clostridium] sordellii] [Paeniclostridium sordellii]
MYKCYRLQYDGDLEELIKEYGEKGKKLMGTKKESVRKNLESYFKEKNVIDFTSIQEDWFPIVQSDIFISHSHKDIDVINALAGWFKEKFDVEVFVDSYIWEYCDELLREIDEKYCRQPNGEFFDYYKRNFSTTHVHLTLSSALNKMIDSTECVIFVETENSISLKNDIEVGTNSAWIYSELLATRILGKKIPERLISKIEKRQKEKYSLNEAYDALFRGKIDHFIPLSANDLEKIGKMELNGDKAYLDKLYSSVNGEVKILNE